MSDSPLDQDLEFEALAAGLRLELNDTASDLRRLAAHLNRLLPEYLECQYGPGTPATAPVRSLVLTLGDEVLALTSEHGQVRYDALTRVHGIDLNRRPLSQADWTERVTQAVRQQTTTLADRRALGNLL